MEIKFYLFSRALARTPNTAVFSNRLVFDLCNSCYFIPFIKSYQFYSLSCPALLTNISNFHSYRFVKQDLVIRLHRPPSAGLIDRLNRDFADIVTSEVRQTDPLPDEADEPDKLHLHRLLMHFNREDYGRLRQMIDVINSDE